MEPSSESAELRSRSSGERRAEPYVQGSCCQPSGRAMSCLRTDIERSEATAHPVKYSLLQGHHSHGEGGMMEGGAEKRHCHN